MLTVLLICICCIWAAAGAKAVHPHSDLPVPTSIHELISVPRSEHEKRNRSPYHHRNLAARGPEITPLYPGYGTHFSYVYVGTPSQRQSVIIDTGSHYTAFPCTGCSQCGQHTDSYWDVTNSSTAVIPRCGNDVCSISQSYSEGSSWKAFKVTDKLWVSGLNAFVVPGAESYSVDFTFGCQSYETGLFRSQLADGIMGMSITEDTLPAVLNKNGVTSTRMFGLCYRVGGGIMTLGGIDQRIHSHPGVNYAKLLNPTGWFVVKLVDILMEEQSGGEKKTIGEDNSKYNSGKGCIVDSGTTDTYLPSSISTKFQALFKQISGIAFTQANIPLTSQQLAKMPNLIFEFESTDGNTFQITMPWSSYVDSVGGGKYAFRIYLTEGSGTVLGANFMNNYNVIFDPDNNRVGFAKSSCKFEDYVIPQTHAPTPVPTRSPTTAGEPNKPTNTPYNPLDCLVPIDECSARCTESKSFISIGTQAYNNHCNLANFSTYSRDCGIACSNGQIVRGDPLCPEKPWSECNKSCIQTRSVPSEGVARKMRQRGLLNHTMMAQNQCNYQQQSRSCYTGSCPIIDGDYLVFIDLRVRIDPLKWSYVYSEDFFGAFSELFGVR